MMGFGGPNTINIVVFGPSNPILWVLGPLGYGFDMVSAHYSIVLLGLEISRKCRKWRTLAAKVTI